MDKQILYWTMSLFGTAIGAGILFLPISIGTGGFLSLIIMAILAYPLTHYSHKLLAKFIYKNDGLDDITEVLDNTFGKNIGLLIIISYFLEIFVVLLLYTIALTNAIELILTENLGFVDINRVILSFFVVAFLMFIISRGLEVIIKVISYLVFIFIISIFILSIYLIQFYNGGVFNDFSIDLINTQEIFKSTLYVIPIMIFAFNHVAIISSMVIEQKKLNIKSAENSIDKILEYSHILMVFVVLFFLFSCAFVFNSLELNEANSKNINILSYISIKIDNFALQYIAPIIASIAIMKSFLGHYMGTKEGFEAIIKRSKKINNFSNKSLSIFTFIFVSISCFTAAVLNPSILDMINKIIAPLIAVTLFLVPAYVVINLKKMEGYKGISAYFVGIIGILATGVIIFEFF